MVIVLALLMGVLLAAPAQAAEVNLRQIGYESAPKGPGDLLFGLEVVAAPGEANRLVLDAAGRGADRPPDLLVRDDGAPLTAGENCQLLDDGGVVCRVPEPADRRWGSALSRMRVDAGDGDDRAELRSRPSTNPPLLLGGPGDDRLRSAGGTLDGGPGADDIDGLGVGAVTVTYESRTNPLRVSADGAAGDGEAGERDNVGTHVRTILGGAGDDELASVNAAELSGGDGNDRLLGGAGDDRLGGAQGDDQLVGGGGNDSLYGFTGADVLRGGDGRDHVGYDGASAGVRVTLDDQPNDGIAGERDDVGADVEVVDGGRYDDVLVGNERAQTLGGDEGADRLIGGGGDDVLRADDDLWDRDVAVGGAGRDVLHAQARDVVRAVDGAADRVVCNDGPYETLGQGGRIDADRSDVVVACAPPILLTSSASPVAVGRDGRFRLRVRCPRWGVACDGHVVVRRGRRALIARVRLRAGRTRTLGLRLTRPMLRSLRRAGEQVYAFGSVTSRASPRSRLRAPRSSVLLRR